MNGLLIKNLNSIDADYCATYPADVVGFCKKAAAALEAQEWQPIEEYHARLKEDPRRYVYQVLCGHSESRWVRMGRFYPECGRWYYSGTNERSQYSEEQGGPPTHVKPLSDPPKGQS